jgi:hypothetical protein
MNSGSKPDPAGENSRRGFLQRIAAAAAASSVAANASAQQPAEPAAAARAAERNALPEPGPLSKQPMPTIRLGKHNVSRLVIGTNGIGTHYSTVLSRTFREWNTPEQQMRVFKHCEELGINMRIQTRDQINQYNKEFGGHMLFSSNSEAFPPKGDPREALKRLAANGPIAIHSSASGSDEFWRSGQLPKLREWCKIVRDTGVLVCINGHIPEMFMEIDSQGWDVDYYMTALYVFGRTHEEWEKVFKGDLDLAPLQVGELQTEYNSPYYGGEIAWVHGDPPKMLKVIKQAKKPCLAFKILASGNLMATAQAKVQQQIVEARFKYVLENIKSTDGIVCAMWNKYEDQYALNKEYVVKYGGSSIRAA